MTDPEPLTLDHQEGNLKTLAEEHHQQHQELIAALQRELGLTD